MKKILLILLCLPLLFSSCGTNNDKTKENTIKEPQIPKLARDYNDFIYVCGDGTEYPLSTRNFLFDEETSDNLTVQTLKNVLSGISIYSKFNLPNGTTNRLIENEPFLIFTKEGKDTISLQMDIVYSDDNNIDKEASVSYYFNNIGSPYIHLHNYLELDY